MSIVFPKVGGIQNANFLGSVTWANKPSATAVAGASIYVTDIGAGGGGSYWYSDGVRWRAVGGKVSLMKSTTATSVSFSADAQVAEQSPIIRAGAIQANDTLRVILSIQKSAGAATTVTSLHLGSAGTKDDAVIWQASQPAGASRSMTTAIEIMRVSATTVRTSGLNTAAVYAQGTTLPADVTVSSMDSTALYLTLSFQNASETTACKTISMELLT
jgi:hypothetical protein